MKLSSLTKVILISVSCGTLLGSVAQAHPRRHHNKGGVLDQNEEEQYVKITGSNLRQRVKVKSIGTTTPYNVRIYSQRELESTGRSTPGEALMALDPSIQLSGRH